MNERVVEVPWMVQRLGHPDALLDVGSAGAMYHADLIASGAGRIVALDTRHFEAPRPIEVVIGNAAQMPAEWRAAFEVVVCLSVIDHVGLDAYGNAADDDAEAIEKVMHEMRRVLKSSGRLLLTFPIGRPQVTTHPSGGQRVFSVDAIARLLAEWPRKTVTTYRLRNGQYSETPLAECRDAEYLGDRAEAVACIEAYGESKHEGRGGAMRIQYVGSSSVRVFGAYRFAHGEICEVDDAVVIGEMLTQPGVDFVVADDDPLALEVGAARAAELALDGILTPAQYVRPSRTFFNEEVGHRTDDE